jgi:hypothetical protein
MLASGALQPFFYGVKFCLPLRLVTLRLIAFGILPSVGDAQTLSDALDAPALGWNSPAGAIVQNDMTFDGIDAVKLSSGSSPLLGTSISGPARLELKVRTSTEQNADFFEASVGGVVQVRLSGENDWQTAALDIPAGSQRIELA